MPELFSVVMPSFNQAAFIERSVRSVLHQDYSRVELIVADGGSKDGTQAILERLSGEYTGLNWFSEPDTGPANAINKALDRARGEFVGWLNSDDMYTPGALVRAASALRDHPDWIVCYGHGEHIDASDEIIGDYPTRRPQAGLSGFLAGCYICQPTLAFRMPLLAMIDKLDETQKTSFDYEFWLRIFSFFPDRVGFIDAVQAQSRLHEDCLTTRMRRTVAIEGVQLAKQYLGGGSVHWLSTYLEDIRPQFDEAEFRKHAVQLFAEVETCVDTQQLERLKQDVLAMKAGEI